MSLDVLSLLALFLTSLNTLCPLTHNQITYIHTHNHTGQWRIDVSPELAVSLGLLNTRRSTHSLDPRSHNSFRKRLEYVKKSLATTKALLEEAGGYDKLPVDGRLSVELFVDQLQTYVDNSPYRTHLQCVNRLEGPQTDLPLYASYLPLNSSADVAFYLDFLSNVAKQNEEVIALLQAGLDENNKPSKCR